MSDQALIDELSKTAGEESDLSRHVPRCGLRFRLLAAISMNNGKRLEAVEALIASAERKLILVLAASTCLLMIVVLFGREKGGEIVLELLKRAG